MFYASLQNDLLQHYSPKCWNLFTKLDNVKSQEDNILLALVQRLSMHGTCIKIVPTCFSQSWLSSGEHAVHRGRNRSLYLASYTDASL